MNTKVCTKCQQEKTMSEFGKNSSIKDGLSIYCKNCIKRKNKYFNEKFRNQRLKQKKIYYINNKNSILLKTDIKHTKTPWSRVYKNIKQRCTNSNKLDYKYYGGRGIECRITEEELEKLWYRDNADSMKKPSVDRKDNNGHYEYDNCEFIEHEENISKAHKRKILQYDLNKNFIKEWDCLKTIEQELQFLHQNVGKCCRSIYKQAYGFIWRYKDA